jgi:hypothetical protein
MIVTHLSDADLFTECVAAIGRAAVGESRGGDEASYQHAMGLLAESDRRHVAAGHDRRCVSSVYQRAFAQATADHAGRTVEPLLCTCAKSA